VREIVSTKKSLGRLVRHRPARRRRHLGNILAEPGEDVSNLDTLHRENIDTSLFDTAPYLTDKSDIVALLVFSRGRG
jgi:hypothetical protein